MFTTKDDYGNRVFLPGDTGPSTRNLNDHSDGQYAVVDGGKVISDGTVLCSTGALASFDALSYGLTPVKL